VTLIAHLLVTSTWIQIFRLQAAKAGECRLGG
jgi:hypothetical protein